MGAPSWPPSPPSSRCGSPSRSTTSPAPALSTGSASKLTHNNNNNNSYCHHSHSHYKSSQATTSSHQQQQQQQQQQQDTTTRPWRKRAWRDSYENSTIFLTKYTQWCFPFVI